MGVLLFKCVRCHEAMEKLCGPSGMMDSYAADELAGRWRRALSMAIWKTTEPRGRGHTLEGVLWAGEATRGPNHGLPDAEGVVRWIRRWVDHLIDEGVRTESELEEHIGGWEPERDVLYPPKIKPFKLAFAAIAVRLGKLSDAEKRLDTATMRSEWAKGGGGKREARCEKDLNAIKRQRKRDLKAVKEQLQRAKTAVDAAKKGLHAECAVFDAIGAARDCTSDAVRKALKKSEKSRREGGKQWQPFVDYRQIITATPPRPGTRRLYIDIEELERRHPGTWERLKRE